jgi:acyl dehydratase
VTADARPPLSRRARATPVFIGDTIRASATIKEKRDHPRRARHGIVVELLEVSNQDSENALVCEHLYLVERRVIALGS